MFTNLSSRHLLLRLYTKIILHLSSTTLEQKSLLKIKKFKPAKPLYNAVDSLIMRYIVMMNFHKVRV
jgi:hypothetical protein